MNPSTHGQRESRVDNRHALPRRFGSEPNCGAEKIPEFILPRQIVSHRPALSRNAVIGAG